MTTFIPISFCRRAQRAPAFRALASPAIVDRAAVLLMLNIFLLFTTYYLLKTVRESLILTQGGAEVKSYSAVAQTAILFLVVPAYGALASRVKRAFLITWITFFFAMNLLLFVALAHTGCRIGIAFYIWLGIFSVTLVTQLWALANDIYTEEQGMRLFPVLGLGGALGALTGSELAGRMFGLFGIVPILLLSAAVLLCSIVLTRAVDKHARNRCPLQNAIAKEPIPGDGGFKLVLTNRFFLFIAVLIVLGNLVNTTGEFVLGKMAIQSADRLLASQGPSLILREQFIGRFYASYFVWGNVVGLILQFAFVSRILQRLGVRRSLFLLPGISLLGYAFLAFSPGLRVARIAKIAENSIDYTLEKTALNALFLRTSRAAKYKAKTAIDTFFYRTGDLLQAVVVAVGSCLALTIRHYAAINVACSLLWMGVLLALAREDTSVVPQPAVAPSPCATAEQEVTPCLIARN